MSRIRRYKTNFVESFDGTKIHYTSQGEGIPVVLCNGFVCDTIYYTYLVKHLRDKFRVVTWDYRGHGKSALPADVENVTIEMLVRDLLAVMNDDNIDKAVLAGHSMGVQVILEFFRSFPQRVLGLIPICGSYKNPLATFDNSKVMNFIFPIFRWSALTFEKIFAPFWRFATPSPIGWGVAYSIGINKYLIKRDDFAPYLEHLSRMNIRLFMNLAKSMREHSAEDVLPLINVPTLIIAGDEDTMTPLWVMMEMYKRIKNSEILVVRHGRHATTLEAPELVNLRIEKFLMERIKSQKKNLRNKISAKKYERGEN